MGLDVNHGFSKHLVENSEVSKRREHLQHRLATSQQRAEAACLRSEKAGEQYRQRNQKLHAQVKQLNQELNRCYDRLVAQAKYPPTLSYEQKLEYKEAETKVKVEVERKQALEWQAYSRCNQEYRKYEEYTRERQQLEKQLEQLKRKERAMQELDNAKDQVMTCFKLALANLGMWLRDQCFPENYSGCSWKRMLPFFELGGWVSQTQAGVRVELQPFNDCALNRDLAKVCELVTKAGLTLPDGSLLQMQVGAGPGSFEKQIMAQAS